MKSRNLKLGVLGGSQNLIQVMTCWCLGLAIPAAIWEGWQHKNLVLRGGKGQGGFWCSLNRASNLIITASRQIPQRKFFPYARFEGFSDVLRWLI